MYAIENGPCTVTKQYQTGHFFFIIIHICWHGLFKLHYYCDLKLIPTRNVALIVFIVPHSKPFLCLSLNFHLTLTGLQFPLPSLVLPFLKGIFNGLDFKVQQLLALAIYLLYICLLIYKYIYK